MTATADQGAPLTPPVRAARPARVARFESRTIAIIGTVVVLCYLVLGPVLMLVVSSFKGTDGTLPFESGVPWTLDNYITVLTNPATYEVLGNTFIFAIGALALSFSLSIAFAWLIERTDMPLRNALFVVIVASIGIPNVIIGIAYALLLNPTNGLVNLVLRDVFGLDTRLGPLNVYTLPGMVFVQGVTLVPITFLLIAAAFRGLDAAMEDAGSTSGATFRTVIRRISLPLLTPALLSALVYQFVSVIESFDIPLVLGLRGGITVLSTQIYIESRPAGGLPDFGLAAAYSMLLLALAIGPLLLYNRVIGNSERYATIGGHSYTPRRMRLGSWKWPSVALSLTFITISLLLPGLVMLWTSLQPFYAIPSAESIARISLDAYADVLTDPRFHEAVVNTLILGVSTAVLAMGVGLSVSWVLVRTKSRLRPLLDILAFTPHAMPGVIIGLSVLLIYLILPVPIYGTIWIMVIALGTQYISISTRLMTGGISQVQNELEEAAAVSGASWWPSIRRIVFPLVLPAVINGLLLVFLLAIKNLTLPLILYTPETVVLSTLLWTYWDRANTADTAALGTILVVITLILGTLLRRFSREGPQLT
ncbi:MAG TPA: iron ABC transporter permease [Candidatus Saccharimonadales bacterium]|nr:iron ABC transporter permease [Candidatus Saccharimonadales bacterium]